MIPKRIKQLVNKFEKNFNYYHNPRYKEAELRVEFINPFWKELGWDMENLNDYALSYRDVIHEQTIRIGTSSKAPDYCFRIGGMNKFFLEAKKPSLKVKQDSLSAFQIRRYAWSCKLPISILTNFDYMAIYECRTRPKATDSPATGRNLQFTYKDYINKWTEIASIFSRDAVLKGDFDKFIESSHYKQGTTEVDSEFLKEIESWREILAKNILLNNQSLKNNELNFAVQITINRIIFLRISEDRGIERYEQLKRLCGRDNIYRHLLEIFYKADSKYNSGLFHFFKERNRPAIPDQITTKLKIDDSILKSIINSLYYPDSPYEFSVLPTEILGNVYEQFLGKVIEITPAGRAKIKNKPEVRKSGGIYYTPNYICKYIVENVLENVLSKKDPTEVTKLKILDPSCGSGSFLLQTYQKLIDWHRDWYLQDGVRKNAEFLYQGKGGQYLLTTAEKKRILLNNIYGVDIDPQAVEITKLSLLLKILEGESEYSIASYKKQFHQKVLPDLKDNIKCGNSIIGPDFFKFFQLELHDKPDFSYLNIFDWENEFPNIFNTYPPGFDAVIGNPPYLNIDECWGKKDPRLKYLKAAFPEIYNDKTDILFYFLSKAANLTKNKVSFIVSRAFLEAYKADKLRKWLGQNVKIQEIIDFKNHNVFSKQGISTAIITYCKQSNHSMVNIFQLHPNTFVPTNLKIQLSDPSIFVKFPVKHSDLGSSPWIFTQPELQNLNTKIDNSHTHLGEILIIGQGMQTGLNDAFGKLDKNTINKFALDPKYYFIRVRNSDIDRYIIHDNQEYILYLEEYEDFSELPIPVQEHLNTFKKQLKNRAAYKRGNCQWWKFTWPLHNSYMNRKKIYCPYLSTSNRFALDETGRFLGLTDTTVIFDNNQPEDLRYFLALLNSKLLTYRFRFIGKLKGGGIREFFWNSVTKIPIKRIYFKSHEEATLHDYLVNYVKRIEELNLELAITLEPQKKTNLQRQINALDKNIDLIVYQLYRLTNNEIHVIDEYFSDEKSVPRLSDFDFRISLVDKVSEKHGLKKHPKDNKITSKPSKTELINIHH